LKNNHSNSAGVTKRLQALTSDNYIGYNLCRLHIQVLGLITK
jgi:hypothetical protein